MQRIWTDQSRDEWIERRTERRKQQGRPDPHFPREDSLERERTNVRDTVHALTTKTLAWELQRYPLVQHPAPFAGKLYLPLRHLDDDHTQTVKFREGEDLNLLVHRFYDSKPDPGFKGVNFVSQDSIASKRHEYLGPAPFVAGYRFDAESKTARIEWWDPYVKLMWIGQGTWKIDVYFDHVVEGWVSRPRGDFDDHAIDLKTYLGL